MSLEFELLLEAALPSKWVCSEFCYEEMQTAEQYQVLLRRFEAWHDTNITAFQPRAPITFHMSSALRGGVPKKRPSAREEKAEKSHWRVDAGLPGKLPKHHEEELLQDFFYE